MFSSFDAILKWAVKRRSSIVSVHNFFHKLIFISSLAHCVHHLNHLQLLLCVFIRFRYWSYVMLSDVLSDEVKNEFKKSSAVALQNGHGGEWKITKKKKIKLPTHDARCNLSNSMWISYVCKSFSRVLLIFFCIHISRTLHMHMQYMRILTVESLRSFIECLIRMHNFQM